jgi:hypothetical protein
MYSLAYLLLRDAVRLCELSGYDKYSTFEAATDTCALWCLTR